MGVENVDPLDQLKKLGAEIESAADFGVLRPILPRLNEIIRAWPDDFDVQFTGNELRQRLMERGALLRRQEASPPPPPTAMPAPRPPARPAVRAPVRPRPKLNWNRRAVIGPVAGLLVALLLIFLAVDQVRKRNIAAVRVGIATTPSGASVRVVAQQPAASGRKETACASDCEMMLAPGAYEVSASLDGFEPAARAINVTARRPAKVSLRLQPQPPSVRLLTDMTVGKVVVDNGPAVDLQDGQLALDKVAPGSHTLKVTGQNGEASFAFEIAEGRPPAVTGSVQARNMIAVLVASFRNQARVVTNAGPWKLAVNGRPQGDAGPLGTDLTAFKPGVNEIVVGEGANRRNMSETFVAAPMLTAFLKTDVNAGTLIVSTGQDDVRVFLNDTEYRRRTQRGQLRVQVLGKVTVRVAKSGFQDEPPQTVEVKKGEELRLKFDMKALPRFASLQIQGAAAGTEVLVDQMHAGTVGTDGAFSLGAIEPGDHMIELRREQHLPKRLQRSFRAGQAVVLAGADAVLAAANGTVRFTRNPASSIVTYRRGEETESHEARGNQVELPPGSYLFSATAPGFAGASIRLQLAAGDNRIVDFVLAPARPAAPPPAAAKGMEEFEDAQGWRKDGDRWIRRGGGFAPYGPQPKGVFTFTVELLRGGNIFRAGRIRWCFQYLDSSNYLLFELDRNNLWAGVIRKGERLERLEAPHNLGNQKTFTIRVLVSPDRLVHEVRVGEEWKVLDTFAEPGRDFTQGKFGFLIQGNDEIAISDFKFQPK